MKRLIFGTFLLLLALPLMSCVGIGAGVDADGDLGVEASVTLPTIEFAVEPEMVALPGAEVYVVPDVAAEIFFAEGWWWRPYGGEW